MPIVERLRHYRSKLDRMIIFCQKRDHCPMLYSFFSFCLGKDFTEPPGMPTQSPQFRLVDFFTSGTHESIKTEIVKCFTGISSLRIVISTIAFGMGVDCSDVREIIHFGPPQTVEEYVQHIGRAGRDGKPAIVCLFHGKGLICHTDPHLLNYCKHCDKCRRDFLFQDFDSYSHNPTNIGCNCCDICAKSCVCSECKK